MIGLRRSGSWCLALAAGLAACSSPLPSQICATSITYNASYTTSVKRDLDLVFVIDDSVAMAGWQAQLASQLPELARLGKCADCASPSDVHIGVVSSDLGVGAALNAAFPGCRGGGDGGQLRSQPEGMCTDTTLDPGATFIVHRSRGDGLLAGGVGHRFLFRAVASHHEWRGRAGSGPLHGDRADRLSAAGTGRRRGLLQLTPAASSCAGRPSRPDRRWPPD